MFFILEFRIFALEFGAVGMVSNASSTRRTVRRRLEILSAIR